MKKVICLLLCFLVLLSTTACDVGKSINEQYADIVKEYEELYGAISKDRDIFYSSDALGGVSYIDLIDFNGDGVLELLIIFDQCTNEKVMGGALTCHIYARIDNKATLVYNNELQVAPVTNNFLLNGRTFLLSEVENKKYIVFADQETIELREYTRYSYNYGTKTEEVDFDYKFKIREYMAFDGNSFTTVGKVANCKDYPQDVGELFMVDDELCSETEYNNEFIEITEYIECSTYFYEELIEHNNTVKQSLGLAPMVVEEISKNSTTESATEKITVTETTKAETTEPTTQLETTEIITSTEESVKKDMSAAEMAEAIAAHYTAQRTDGGGFNVSSSEASDKGDYYVFLVRYKCSPEEEAEMDRRFREEGIVPSANVLAFDVTVEKSTGKVVRSNDNDTWYLW